MPDTTILPSLNFNNFSGEIAAILRQELRRTGAVIGKESDELLQMLNDTDQRQAFLMQYEAQFKKTLLNILSGEILPTIDKDKLGAFANDALRKLKSGTGARYVDELLSPILTMNIGEYAESAIKEHLSTIEGELEKVINSGLSVLKNRGVAIMELTETALSDKFKELQAQLQANTINKILVKNIAGRAYELIKTSPEKIIISAENDIETLFSEQFNAISDKADAVAKAAFTELGNSIKTLTDNEQRAHEVLEGFQNEIDGKWKKIAGFEDKIKAILNNPVRDLNELAQAQIEHARLVAENLFHNNIINSYLKKGIEIIDSVDAIKDKAGKLFSGQILDDFKNRIDELKKPTFSSVVNFASETVNTIDQISGTMEKFGIFSNAAKSVGKFVNYAKLAIGLATALLPPNPIGIIGALGSIGGLFGGGGGPTIEEQMFEAMQKGFSQLNERLDEIEQKINKLTEMVQAMYKNLMQSLQIISNQLDGIKEQVGLSNDMLNFMIYKDYNLVESIILGKSDIEGASGLKLYQRWYNARQLTITALRELGTLIESPVNLKSIIRQDFIIPGLEKQFGQIAQIQLNAYNKTLVLFKNIFKNIDNDERLKNLLLVPPQNNTFLTFQKGTDLIPDKQVFDFESVADNYYNGYFIAKLVSQYIELHPFFILSKNNQFEPFSNLDDFMVEDNLVMIKDKFSPTKIRLNHQLDVVNESIIQQSILAGSTMLPFINTILFGGNGPNLQVAIDAIKANEVLAKNIAVFFIRTKMGMGQLQAFSDLYFSVKTDRSKIKDLNNLLIHGQGNLEFGFDETNAANPLLCLYYKVPGSTDKVQLPLPDLTIIEEQQMVYNGVLFSLLDAKEKIISTLLDIGFFKDLPPTQSKIYKEVFFLQA